MDQVVIDLRGTIDSYGWQVSDMRYLLRANKGKPVLCRVNSYGGDVNGAMMISQYFQDHGDVTVRFLGLNASAVTWMAYGAKKVEMANDGMWLAHRSSSVIDTYASMNAKKLEDYIKELQKQKKMQEALDLVIAKKYADKSGMSIEDVAKLMDKAEWLTADQVKDYGFIDEIVDVGPTIQKTAKAQLIQNCIDLDIPCPHFVKTTDETNADAPASSSLMQRIINGVRSIFTESPESSGTSENSGTSETSGTSESSNSNKPQSSNQMEKKFILINALLAITGFEVADNKVTLTTDQLQNIENALKERDDFKALINKATETIDGISDNVKSIEGLNNKVLAVKNVLDRIPLAAPAGANLTPAKNEADEKQKQLDESAVDPINEEARNL